MRIDMKHKAIDQQEHAERLEAARLRVATETAEWVRSRNEILTTSFLAVAEVRRRAEEASDRVWNMPNVPYEVCEALTELLFGIAAPPTARMISHVRHEVPADPLRIGDGITIPEPDEIEEFALSGE